MSRLSVQLNKGDILDNIEYKNARGYYDFRISYLGEFIASPANSEYGKSLAQIELDAVHRNKAHFIAKHSAFRMDELGRVWVTLTKGN